MYPFIYIFGRDIGTYGLCMAAGFVLAFVLALRRGKPNGLIVEDLLIVAAFALGMALLGGTLMYIIVTYSLEEIIEFICCGDFRFLSSGIVFYGGLIGGLSGAMIGIRVADCKFSVIERAVVPFIPLGHAIGRIGCILAGCCHGYAYDGPLALYYPNSVSNLSPEQGHFPVQPLESLLNVGLCLFLLWYEKKETRPGKILFAYMGLYAVLRFFLEMLRGDVVRGGWYIFSTSQIVSMLLLGVSLVGFCEKNKKAPLC